MYIPCEIFFSSSFADSVCTTLKLYHNLHFYFFKTWQKQRFFNSLRKQRRLKFFKLKYSPRFLTKWHYIYNNGNLLMGFPLSILFLHFTCHPSTATSTDRDTQALPTAQVPGSLYTKMHSANCTRKANKPVSGNHSSFSSSCNICD